MQEPGWNFQRINSMKISFYKTCELIGSPYVKTPLRSSALLSFKKDDIYCFLWSIVALLHPCENSDPNRVPNYKRKFDELNNDGFHFSN